MADVDESFVRRLADLNALEEEPSLMQRTYTEMRDLRAEVACMRSELQQVRALLQGLVQPQPTLPKIRQPPPTNRERMSPASIGPPSQAPTVAPTVAPPLNTQMNAAVSTGPSMPSPSPPPQRSGTTSARRDRRFSPDGTQKVARNPGGGVLSSSQATVQWEEAVVKFARILWEMDVEGALHGLLRCQPAAERFAQWLRELKVTSKACANPPYTPPIRAPPPPAIPFRRCSPPSMYSQGVCSGATGWHEHGAASASPPAAVAGE